MTNSMANSKAISKTRPRWVALLAILGAVWYAFGLMQFWFAYSGNFGELVASGEMTQAHANAVMATPTAIWLSFFLASASGLLGTIALMIKPARSFGLFVLSLASALIFYTWVYGISGTAQDRPQDEIVIAIVVVLVTFAFTLLGYWSRAGRK